MILRNNQNLTYNFHIQFNFIKSIPKIRNHCRTITEPYIQIIENKIIRRNVFIGYDKKMYFQNDLVVLFLLLFHLWTSPSLPPLHKETP